MAKLLLVEDDNNLREIYEARLQAEGYTIVSARDGEEALVVAKAEKPDLVISDVMMPKISGFEMLDILRNTEELKGVKIIMLTALGQSDDQQRADKLGADRYLVKSQVTLEDIVRVAHELLGDQAEAAADSPPSADTTAPAAKPAPAAEPAPAPESAPEVKSEPVAVSTDDVAESTAKEEADVEAKIEDFVTGATTEPTAPASTAAETAVPAASPSVSTSDDKLMSEAVDKLVASADDGAAATASAPAAKTTIPVNVDPEPGSGSADDDDTGSKKIIKPLEDKPKKDIAVLLAEEEAKEIQAAPAAATPGLPEDEDDKPAGAPMEAPGASAGTKTDQADPGSIAL